MRRRLSFFVTLLLVSAFASAADVPSTPATPPPAVPALEDFFGPRLLTHARLSPDGTRLVGTATWEGDSAGLLVLDLATTRITALKGSDSLDIYRVYWHGDDRLLFNVTEDNLYSQGLYSAPADRLDRHIPIRLYDAMDFVGQPVARPDRVLIWIRQSAEKRGQPGPLVELDVTRSILPARSGALVIGSSIDFTKSVTRNFPMPDGPVLGFESDIDGDPGLAFVVRAGKPAWLYWDADSASWKSPAAATGASAVLARDADRDYVWIVARDPQRGSQLCRMGLATGLVEPPVYEDSRYDLRGADLLFSRNTRELVGVRHQRQRGDTHWFSEKFVALQATIDASLPRDEDHRIADWDDAENRFVIHSSGARQPGVYHLFDASERSLKRIGETMPDLKGRPLSRAIITTFTARDGLALEGYVTLPEGVSKQNPAPLIVLPHGGPQARDTWSFDAEAQFLASLGYAVLQPNYRGSAGYLWPEGSDDYEAAYGAMRDDVIDATRAALRSGLFDPACVAIVGSSFGGYLALACSVEEPALFRCAASVCGVFDWAEHVKSKRHAANARPGEYQLLLGLLGDPRQNQEAYEAVSPLNHLDRLRIPMLIAHGKADSIVSVKQSRLLAKELKRRDLPHQTFYRTLGGHGFYAANDRIAFYRTLERFLGEHLAAPHPTKDMAPR